MTNQTERNRRGREILAELGRRFPHLFAVEVWESHLLLAIGIDAQLRERCPDISKEDFFLALRSLIGRRQYKVALSTPGAVRFNLDGSEQGAVSDENACSAKCSIKATDAKRLEAAERARSVVNGNGHAAASPPANGHAESPISTDGRGRLTRSVADAVTSGKPGKRHRAVVRAAVFFDADKFTRRR